jgi:methionine sulfoxide reductase heme-binding subunit
MAPWRDYSGRVSPLKTVVFVALFVPAIWVAVAYIHGDLGARPRTEAIHQIGLWTIRFLFLSLLVTPARQLLNWPQLLLVRRMIGVAAACYVLIHLTLYTWDEAFDLPKVAAEIVLRIYLTIGFVALSGLVTLATTSTDGMTRWLGGREWQKLHRIVYVIAFLAVVHFCMQSKLNEWEPTVMAGFYVWLMGWRLLARQAGRMRLPIWRVAALSVGVGLATALGETVYFMIGLGAPFWRVLEANLSLDTGVRPAWVVLGVCVLITLAGALRRPRQAPRRLAST